MHFLDTHPSHHQWYLNPTNRFCYRYINTLGTSKVLCNVNGWDKNFWIFLATAFVYLHLQVLPYQGLQWPATLCISVITPELCELRNNALLNDICFQNSGRWLQGSAVIPCSTIFLDNTVVASRYCKCSCRSRVSQVICRYINGLNGCNRTIFCRSDSLLKFTHFCF